MKEELKKIELLEKETLAFLPRINDPLTLDHLAKIEDDKVFVALGRRINDNRSVYDYARSKIRDLVFPPIVAFRMNWERKKEAKILQGQSPSSPEEQKHLLVLQAHKIERLQHDYEGMTDRWGDEHYRVQVLQQRLRELGGDYSIDNIVVPSQQKRIKVKSKE